MSVLRHRDQNNIFSTYLAESTVGENYKLPTRSPRTGGNGGPTAFWDFYMLEALQAKVNTMQVDPDQPSHGKRIELASSLINIALEQCVTQLAERMRGYLIGVSMDEFAHLGMETDSGVILTGDMLHEWAKRRPSLDEFHRQLVVYRENLKQSATNSKDKLEVGSHLGSMPFKNWQQLQDIFKGQDISSRAKLRLARINRLMETYEVDELYQLAKFLELYERTDQGGDPDDAENDIVREIWHDSITGGFNWQSSSMDPWYEQFQTLNSYYLMDQVFRDTESAWGWHAAYGGPAWADAVTAAMQLGKANTIQQKIVLIDHIYDLEHNSGQLLNKDGLVNVSKDYLDTRFQAKSLDDLLKSGLSLEYSPYVAKLAQMVGINEPEGWTVNKHRREQEAKSAEVSQAYNNAEQQLDNLVNTRLGMTEDQLEDFYDIPQTAGTAQKGHGRAVGDVIGSLEGKVQWINQYMTELQTSNQLDGENIYQLKSVKHALLNLYISTEQNILRMALWDMLRKHKIIPLTEPYPAGSKSAQPVPPPSADLTMPDDDDDLAGMTGLGPLKRGS